MLVPDETIRLSTLYGSLRNKLLDLTRRNRMLSYTLGARSRRSLQIVDAVPNSIFRALLDQSLSLELGPLEEPKDLPFDEKSEDFLEALNHARNTDIAYLTQIRALESTGRDDEHAIATAELDLRGRVRTSLGLPPRPTLKEINRNEHARSLDINPNAELPTRLENGGKKLSKLQTLKFPDELESTLELVAAEARLAEQEMGLSTLFLSFGFLEWYASDASETKAFAPLLLLPVKLERRKVSGKWRYSISSVADSVETNLSLQKYLELEFGRQLPEIDAFDEDSVTSVDEYLAGVADTVSGLSRWKVHRWMVLGHFSFGRLAMYADLSPENWKNSPVDHQLLRVILQGSEQAGEALPAVPLDYDVDDPEIEKLAPILIQDADASQHSALVDVMRGLNLVIQGPPGTGKSQTITNIIANALASNKTVLFLSEKRAALDVVKRRLDQCGLGDFCLELHSDKSSSKQIVQNLKSRNELGTPQVPLAHGGQNSRTLWQNARSSLKEYLDALHTKDALGDDAFRLIWRAIKGRSEIFNQTVSASGERFAFDDLPRYEHAISALRIFCEAARRFEINHGPLANSIWYTALDSSDTSPDDANLIASIIKTLNESISRIKYEQSKALDFELTSVDDLKSLATIDAVPTTINTALPGVIDQYDLDELEKRLLRKQRIFELKSELSAFEETKNIAASVFDKAALIVKACEPLLALELPAKDCIAEAKRWLEFLPAAIEAFRSLAPALTLFKLPPGFDASGIEAIALSAIFASDLKEHQRQWLASGAIVDGDGFARFEAQRSQISRTDIEWRRQFISYRYLQWPSVDELRNTADLLRQGLRGRALAMVASKTRRASQIAKTLEFNNNSLGAAETVDRLAEHVQQFEAFWRDAEHVGLFGNHWRGPETRFEEIRFGIQYREFLRTHLLPLPQGELIVERLSSMDEEAILGLGKLAKAGHFFRGLPSEVRAAFNSIPASQFEMDASRRIVFAKALSGIDLSNELSIFDRSIADLNRMGILEKRRQELTAEHYSDASVPHPDFLEDSSEAIHAALEAIHWVRNLSGLDRHSTIRKMMLSESALPIRERIFELRKKIAPDLDHLEAGLERLRSSYSVRIDDRSIDALSSKLNKLSDRSPEIYDAIGLRQWLTTLDDFGLTDFVASALAVDLTPDKIPGLFEAYVARCRVDQIRKQTPALRKYNGGIIESFRSAFAESDRAKQKEDRANVRTLLAARNPVAGTNMGPKRDWTEMWMLKNEFQKQARFAPVRSIIQRAPLSLRALKPCFMMSPLSLAKFVPPDRIEFDLLVIDEASQMRPEDAFGAFLRCKQIVVVGDPKQLPPTEFFNKSNEDDSWDEDESIDDDAAESVLESCQKSFGQVRQLKWHYRSRCESLIAFSNAEFYNNSLVTFPTARPDSFSVSLIRVEGVYQARRNIAEASRIAEEAIAFMRAFAKKPE